MAETASSLSKTFGISTSQAQGALNAASGGSSGSSSSGSGSNRQYTQTEIASIFGIPFSQAGDAIRAGAQNVTAESAPTNVAEIQNITGIKIPGLTPTTYPSTEALAYGDAATTRTDEQAKQYEVQDTDTSSGNWIQNAMKTVGLDKSQEKINNLVDQSQEAFQAYSTEIRAARAAQNTLQAEQANLIAARDQQIAAQSNNPGFSQNFTDNRIAQINRNAAPQINLLTERMNIEAAKIANLQGDFQMAQQFIDSAVRAATAEQAFNFQMFSTFLDENRFQIGRLDQKERDALQFKQDKELISYRAAVDRETARITREAGLGGASSFSDIMQRSINAGATAEEAAREAALASENSGVPVSQDTLAEWVREARLLSPQTAPEQVTEEQTSSVGGSNPITVRTGINSAGGAPAVANPLQGLDFSNANLQNVQGAFFDDLFSA